MIKEEVKRELLAGMPDAALEIIIMEDQGAALKWEETGKEFSLNGAMYDVARVKKSNGKTLLYCLNDKNEKQLLKKLALAIKSSNSRNNKSEKQTIKFQLSVFVAQQNQPAFSNLPVKPLYTWANTRFSSTCREINDPPPRV
jgi:hypothetical protein